jgi:tetratricopeptide (TPR) repeat protein
VLEPIDLAFSRVCQTHQEGRNTEAETACRALLGLAPEHIPLLVLLGTILHQTGRPAEARHYLERAALLQPVSLGVLSRLGNACQTLGDYARAADCYSRCRTLTPDCTAAHFELGNCYHALDLDLQAVDCYQQALRLEPGNHAIWCNLGNTLRKQNRHQAALAAYDRALALAPRFDLARWNRSLTLLASGRFEEGFQDYESRLGLLQSRSYDQPRWHGEAIPGKTLLLLAEQGLGDMILFARFAPLARPRVGRLILECPAPLLRLFAEAGLADDTTVLGEALPPFDYFAPLMSLPALLGTTLDTIPGWPRYLPTPDGDRPAATESRDLKVGLVWRANPAAEGQAKRSVRLADLAPIFAVPGIVLHGLQRDVPSADASEFRSRTNLIDAGAGLQDLYDTAAVIGRLDLVLTVDTAVAHLAGAMGKPTWILLPYAADWRWLIDRSDSPWYPSVRLFRQPSQGDWTNPIALVAAELQRLTSA